MINKLINLGLTTIMMVAMVALIHTIGTHNNTNRSLDNINRSLDNTNTPHSYTKVLTRYQHLSGTN